MLQKMKKMVINDKAFTLIELMIVVIILAILAAIAIPQFTQNKEEALDARIKADIKIIQNAVDLYKFEKNEYPSSISDLVNDGYLRTEPKHPDDQNYEYTLEKEADNNITGKVTITPKSPQNLNDED
jgi:prepilin-type N-terminal cleavage/methylation domain-containing protein